jgi:hypothetical protein
MATPPPSPLLNNNATATLQTAADNTSTPYRPSTSGAVSALLFSTSTKRLLQPTIMSKLETSIHTYHGFNDRDWNVYVRALLEPEAGAGE